MRPRPITSALQRIAACTRSIARLATSLLAALVVAACSTAPPEGVTPVEPFELERYLGRWYEIARLDHSFERGLTDVSATYMRRDDGGLAVINRGYDPARGDWREATGRAYFLGSADRASLKVSFFGPFYGGYHVAALDRAGYRWALIVGPNRDYFWILARAKQIAPGLRERLLARASALGIDVDRLIWVEHDQAPVAAPPPTR